MKMEQKTNAMIGALGSAGGGLVLNGLLHDLFSQARLSDELFWTYEIIGIILISVAGFIFFKYSLDRRTQ